VNAAEMSLTFSMAATRYYSANNDYFNVAAEVVLWRSMVGNQTAP
jgi:hypothetical protein